MARWIWVLGLVGSGSLSLAAQELTVSGASVPGGEVTVAISGSPGASTALALGTGFLAAPVPIGGKPFYLDPFQPLSIVPLPALVGVDGLVLPLQIPSNPNLEGIDVHLQGFADGLTNVTSVRMHEPTQVVAPGPAGSEVGIRVLAADVDGDGVDDLLVTGLGVGGSGAVYVSLGPELTTSFTLTDPTPQTDGQFGASLVVADVVGSGDVDILVGAVGAGPLTADRSGEVWIFHGPDFTTTTQLLSPLPAPDSSFGFDMVTGDFEGDGKLQLAVSASTATVGGEALAGRVHVFSTPNLLPQLVLTRPSAPLGLATFGFTLGAADLGGDGRDELIVGAPGASVQGQPQVGQAYVYHGPIVGPPEVLMDIHAQAGSAFACMVSTGDVVGDARPDVVVGVAGGWGTAAGNPAGLVRPGECQVFESGDPALGFAFEDPTPEELGHFGWAVHVDDVDGDGHGDVVVGANLADLPGAPDAGEVFVYRGPDFAIRLELTADVPGANAQLGTIIRTGDLDGDGRRELLIGAPRDAPGGVLDAGSVHIVEF